MHRMKDLPIRWKLVLVTIATSAVVELLAVALIMTMIGYQYRTEKSQDYSVQSRILAANLAAPLVFGDVDAAGEYLRTLRANPEIAAAGAYDAKGAFLTGYTRAGISNQLLPRTAPSRGSHFEGARFMVAQPVARARTRLGSVYLIADTDSLATQFARFGGIMLLAVIGSLIVAVPISIRLNAAISNAIREIAASASRVKTGELNFPLPTTTRTDEIGVLVGSFAQMVVALREMMQQERLRALGQMSSGIAHDINNAMSPVALYTQSLLEHEPGLSERVRSYLETVRRVVADVTVTVGRMRDFSRKRETEMTLAPVDLNRLVRQVLDLTRVRWANMQHQYGFVIDTRTELADDLPIVMGIEGEIRDALTNLIFNAVDAMPEGGTLTLRTRAVGDGAAPGHARLEVVDTGAGMDEETRRRCFEPFFTTKGEWGTGLGMAMVYGVVKRHSAEIEIESAPGKGTAIRLTFLARQPIAAEPRPVSAVLPSQLRILLVDDNPSILESMGVVLELDGHEIVTAAGGQDGIDTFRSRWSDGKPFSVVITDLGMPYVDGNQVARAVKETSPSTPVILLTGWGKRITTEGETHGNVDHVLAKPPELDELRATLALCQQFAAEKLS